MKSDLSLLASFLHRELQNFTIAKMLFDPTSKCSVPFSETTRDTHRERLDPARPKRSENAEPAPLSLPVWQQDAQTWSERAALSAGVSPREPRQPGCSLLQLCSPAKGCCKGSFFFFLNLQGIHSTTTESAWNSLGCSTRFSIHLQPAQEWPGPSAVTSLPCPSSSLLPLPSQQIQRCCCCSPTARELKLVLEHWK